MTGVMAIALALLRVVDPRDESEILDPFARAYLFVAPLEVGLVSFAPLLIAQGFAWSFVGATVLAGFAALLWGGRRNAR